MTARSPIRRSICTATFLEWPPEHAPPAAAADALLTALRPLLDRADPDFDACLDAARRLSVTEREHGGKVRAAGERLGALDRELAARRERLAALEAEADRMSDGWTELVTDLFAGRIAPDVLETSLEPLRDLRELETRRAAAERQGMESARQLREVSVKLEEAKREVRALMEAAESSAAASARARDAAAKDLDRARQQRLTEVQAAEERVVMAEARAEALAREIEALDREHEALLADTRRERAKVEGRSAQGVADAKAETDALRLQLQASETRLDRAMTAGREATAQTAAERARTVDVERELEVARALCSELKSERDSLERRIEVAEAEAAQRVANASKARAEAESEAAKATLTLATKASELNGLQAELEVLKRSGGASAEAARTAQAARQASDEALRSARTEADNAAARARALEDEATSARQSAAQAQAKRDTAESELASLRAKLEAAEEAVRASDARAAASRTAPLSIKSVRRQRVQVARPIAPDGLRGAPPRLARLEGR